MVTALLLVVVGPSAAMADPAVPAFRVSVTSFDFGDVAVGSSSFDGVVELTNVSGSTQAVSLAGGAAGVFGGVTDCGGASLLPGESCTITYRFSPLSLGPATGSTSFTVNGELHGVSFAGNGIRAFVLSATGLDFGPVAVGDSLSLGIDVTNVSGSTQAVSLAGGAAGVFGGVTNCGGASLAPGEHCTITYTFAPTAPGVVDGSTSLSIGGVPYSLTFTGLGYSTDTTGPVVVPTVAGTLGNDGWYTSDVMVSWSVTDPESAITSTSGCDPATIDVDTSAVTFTCSATSDGGTTEVSTTVKRDATAPVVTVTGVSDGASYVEGLVPTPGCDTSDATSGVATAAALTLAGGGPGGTGVITATCDGASDAAGNSGSASATYTVLTTGDAIEALRDHVLDLVDDGVLKPGQGHGLTRPLDAAIRSLDKDKIEAACNQLQDFIDEVTVKTPVPLDPADGAQLTAEAEVIQTALGCS